ncbi:MAG: hypothetical protein M3R63_11680 [Actinomycetota bacterium]|nr:hypothetical protein [Actinomycetota bacterium]
MSTSPTTGGTDEPQGTIPPYGKDESDPIQDAPISASSGKTGPVSEGRIVSDEEEGGVGDTDMTPEPALGVGENISTRGESHAGQEGKEGTKGASGRPTGTTGDETSGVSEEG